MQTATNTTRTLEIDGMTGDVCVQKVTTALQGVPGVTVQSVKVGAATFAADQGAYNAARGALGTAGFKTRESGKAEATVNKAENAVCPSTQVGAGCGTKDSVVGGAKIPATVAAATN